MSEARFTKGEWVVNGGWVDCEGVPICSMGDEWVTYDNDKANAHLIAAAPDMYAMLEGLDELLELLDSQTHPSIELDCQQYEIRNLLAKARGEV